MATPLTQNIPPDGQPLSLEDYEKAGGYRALRKALTSLAPGEIADMVTASNLRGRGGAGFPTGRKWQFVPMGADAPHPKYLVVNADEMEPAAFKDRLLIEGAPHQLIEGIVISAYATQAEQAFIFLRDAYVRGGRGIRHAMDEAYDKGYLGKNILGSGFDLRLDLHISAGRYICGEETALLTALEGKRALPRAKPPFPPVVGLWGKPTVVNNVETVSNIPHIVAHGPQWFKDLSLVSDGGTKIYGVSGHVNRPGAWELPLGTPLGEIIEKHAGGMRDGRRLRAVLPGGASTDLLTTDHLDVKMDFEGPQAAGSRLGTGTLVALDDRTCMVGLTANLMAFFAQESCGWCTPCREGLAWAADLTAAIERGEGKSEDLGHLRHLGRMMAMGRTFCALAPGAMEPLQSVLNYFEEDFRQHIRQKRCPWR